MLDLYRARKLFVSILTLDNYKLDSCSRRAVIRIIRSAALDKSLPYTVVLTKLIIKKKDYIVFQLYRH